MVIPSTPRIGPSDLGAAPAFIAYESAVRDLLDVVILVARWGDAEDGNQLEKIFLPAEWSPHIAFPLWIAQIRIDEGEQYLKAVEKWLVAASQEEKPIERLRAAVRRRCLGQAGARCFPLLLPLERANSSDCSSGLACR